VAIRDRSEIAELHGADGELEAVTLRSGEPLAFSFLFLFLGALPCTDWLADVVARDRNGVILTGTNAGGESWAVRASSQPVTSARGRASAAPPRWRRSDDRAARPRSAGDADSRATDCRLVTGDELQTDTAVVVVGRVALALVGARIPPATHASIVERDDSEVDLNRRVATRPAASPAS
jgi:hypothetical protein